MDAYGIFWIAVGLGLLSIGLLLGSIAIDELIKAWRRRR